MSRPQKKRIVPSDPEFGYFEPGGVPASGETNLTVDEWESLRLADLLGMSYEEAGQKMGISRATFGRIIQQARKTVADALINGKAIRIKGGSYANK